MLDWRDGTAYGLWKWTWFTTPLGSWRQGFRPVWNELKCNEAGFRPPLCTYRLMRMVRWMRWHCPPDTGFEIRALTVWGRARYLSVTEAPHNTEFYTWMGKKHFCFFQTAETGNRTQNSSVKGSGVNHYPRAPRPGALEVYSFINSFTKITSGNDETKLHELRSQSVDTTSSANIAHLRSLGELFLISLLCHVTPAIVCRAGDSA